MSSAHRLTVINIQVKFNENSSKGSGDMERTSNSRVKLMTLNCESRILHTNSLKIDV